MGKALFLSITSSTLNLIVVIVQTSDVSTGELGNFSSRATNATSHVEDLVSVFDANLGCEVMFVAGNGLVETLAIREAAKVEGLAPAIFIKIGGEVVITRYCQKRRVDVDGCTYCLVRVAYSVLRD